MSSKITNFLYVLVGVLLGWLLTSFLSEKKVKTDTIIKTVFSVDSTLIDSLKKETVNYSRALLVLKGEKSEALRLSNKYFNLYLSMKCAAYGDTTKSKTAAAAKIDTFNLIQYVDRLIIDSSVMKKALKLPARIKVSDKWLNAIVSISQDSITIDSIQLNGSVKTVVDEKVIDRFSVQRSVMFERDNPYSTNWIDVYIEQPRLTKKGLRLKQLKAIAISVPASFMTTYALFKTGVLK